MNTPQKRLDMFIAEKFKTKSDFAKTLGISSQAVSKYTANGTSIFGKSYAEILMNLGLNFHWYLTGEGNMLIENPSLQHVEMPSEDIFNVKLFELPVHANQGGAVAFDDLPHAYIPLQVGLNINTKNPIAFKVRGDSMSDVHITDHSIVLIELNANPLPEQRVLVNVNGCLIIKYYVIDKTSPFGFRLFSRNNGHKEYELHKDDNIKIIGVVKLTIQY
jgi:hypothetical protein